MGHLRRKEVNQDASFSLASCELVQSCPCILLIFNVECIQHVYWWCQSAAWSSTKKDVTWNYQSKSSAKISGQVIFSPPSPLPKKNTSTGPNLHQFSNLFAFFCTRIYISYNQKTPMKNLLFWHDFGKKTFPPIRTCKQIRLTNQFYPTPLIFFPAKEHWWWWKCLNFLAVASS